ncbi:MAG: hypothetical protein GTN62_05415 [Gemmatimonadales bacterium]|nr:hypothetical protein [Gemmatimonadales bacterium]NIN49536.1 hypothetical protein [Gemmatimonadales bacterium]NIP07000.1 hypothetical protein [Gemmatimonadales bacterium]NIQ99059.1 hypothetical protein [Gemmatimonadales bacterium]NIS63868.1 hypothetical protein [Gemmatimonadales bacterium]
MVRAPPLFAALPRPARRSFAAPGFGILLILSTANCGGQRPREWHVADGYRWADLNVPKRGRDGFLQLSPSKTGITFSNSVTEEQILDNEHVLNGSGVALGDVDGDGLVDVYFSRLDGPNVLYRNLGGWRFEDVTEQAGVAAPDRLSTGAVLADVDGDGDLDLLTTSMGGPHALFVNDGDGVFHERTEEAGLAQGFYGTTMTLADVEGDGDLDLYVANNKLKTVRDMYPPEMLEFDRVVERVGGGYAIKPEFRAHYGIAREGDVLMRFEHAEPDKFYLNDGTGRFEEVSFTSGRFRDESGEPLGTTPTDWGLTARFQDVDGDGDPDLYVCNDFESPDHVWINDGTGRFHTLELLALRTTSNANMAVEFADLDRDGDVDMFQLDMLDQTAGKQKTQMPSGVPMIPMMGEIQDRQQLPRNTLHLNRGDGTYAEVGYLAGVEASGWSWSVLFLDVELDGYEDLLIGTGHQRDFLDADTKQRIRNLSFGADWRRMRLLYPRLYLRNVAFRNNGDLTFEEVGEAWGFADDMDVSQGMAAGDLDGDGDLDVVANRLGSPAGVYRNEGNRPRVAVRLAGRTPNTQGVGAKIHVFGGPVAVQSKEVIVGGVYVSSSEPLYTFAAGDAEQLTIVVQWRSGEWSIVRGATPNRLYEVHETGAVDGEELPLPVRETLGASVPDAPFFLDVTSELGHTHHEAPYDDFTRQPLLLNRLSQLGPGVAWHDVDRDGDEDLLIASGSGGQLAYYRNEAGRLARVPLGLAPAPLDQTTVLGLPDGSGGTALLVGQTNYEAPTPAAAETSAAVLRVDLRRPRARVTPAVKGAVSSTGPLALADYDADGDLDLFVGGRLLPARYPQPAASRLFRNTAGAFGLDTANSARLAGVGLVSGATFSDVDGDGDADLLLAIDWGPVRLFRNDQGQFTEATQAWGLASYTSLWNGLTTGDLNGDGRLDLIATSWGRNTRFRADRDHPLLAYYADFDRNGTLDLVTARFDAEFHDIVPLRGLERMAPALPYLRQRIPSFADYAAATLQEVLGPPLAIASTLQATTLDHMLFLNRGDRFEAVPLPTEAQLAPAFYAGVADFDGDGHEDVFLTQNFFPTERETQRYLAGRAVWLRGDGSGSLESVPGQVSGVIVYGDQRGAALADYDGDGRVDLVVSQNSAETKLYRNQGGTPGLRVRLVGPAGNPDAIGAVLRLVYRDRHGPAREIHAGSGYWSQDGPVQVLGMAQQATAVWVRWPDAQESTTAVAPGAREVTVRWDKK